MIEQFLAAIFWGSYLIIPVAVALIWAMRRASARRRAILGAALAGLAVIAYARFVEPRILTTQTYQMIAERCVPGGASARVAVFADTHIGVFRNAMPLKRIVAAVNALDPDFTLIAGDFIYGLDLGDDPQAFAPFAGLAAPAFGVLGNHDNERGVIGAARIASSLDAIGVRPIDDMPVEIEVSGEIFELVGLSDSWGRNQKLDLAYRPASVPRIVLTHNPITIRAFGPAAKFDLLVAGHTHGGQVNIPGLTCALTKQACRVVRYGFADTPRGRIFVTSGTGMVGLPLRFNAAPRIDLIEMRFPACG